MSTTRADFTMTFRELSEISIQDMIANRLPFESWALENLSKHKAWRGWLARYSERLQL